MDTVSVLIDLLSHGKNEHNRYVLWREDNRVRPCTEGTSEAKEREIDHNEPIVQIARRKEQNNEKKDDWKNQRYKNNIMYMCNKKSV